MAFPPDLNDDQLIAFGPKDVDFHTKHPLFNDLCPSDSYTADGTYWVSDPGEASAKDRRVTCHTIRITHTHTEELTSPGRLAIW